MAAIHAEHDTQTRLIHTQKSALMSIIGDLGSLRLLGKETETDTPREATPALDPSQAETELVGLPSPTPAGTPLEADVDMDKEEGEEREEKEEGEEDDDHPSSDDVPLAFGNNLNPKARPFTPSRNSTPALSTLRGAGPSASASSSGTRGRAAAKLVDDDIEMGELSEEPVKAKQKKVREEELEEGEASDQSSALSDVPDDI